MKLNDIYDKYKKLKHTLSIEEEKKILYSYVYYTNKLEGNNLTFAQTTELLSKDTVSGSNIKTTDILEQKGMYKALIRMLRAVRNKENLSIDLIKEFNAHLLDPLWKYDEAYIDSKNKGQTLNSFKISQNVIRILKDTKEFLRIEPLSNPKNVNTNMVKLVKNINETNKSIIYKATYLAQEIWLHQPFVDGNKRTGRLLINFLTMKDGYPLFDFNDKSLNYNSLLVEQYIEKKPDLVLIYVKDSLENAMKLAIENEKNIEPNKGSGYRMIL